MFFDHTRFWLNWSMRMIDEDEVGLKEKPEDTIDTSKRIHRNEAPSASGVWAKDSIPNFAIIRNCTLGRGLIGIWEILTVQVYWR